MAAVVFQTAAAGRRETLLREWQFARGDSAVVWENVRVPHDWAIYGPFDRNNDLQEVAVTQDGEKQASLKTGRSGGLPYMGTGWYRTSFDVAPGSNAELLFDGVMSEPQVWVNGHKAGEWKLGYNSFHIDATPYLNKDGKANKLTVRAENKPLSARWYPGAGLYRNVHLIETNPVHIPVWGTHLTTPHVGETFATVRLETKIANADGRNLTFVTDIIDPEDRTVATRRSDVTIIPGEAVLQNLEVPQPQLWSPESPALYHAVTRVLDADGTELDRYNTRFGIRTIEVIPEHGFYLNGKLRKFKGVCNHHDLGPLGAAVNRSALRHQLELLKNMGCDAIRTTHNMPDPQLIELCDEMGFMVMVEPFDEWDIAKCENGYHRFFEEWAERDMVNMLHNYRNNPSVVMWSVGNEVPTQCAPNGRELARFLQDICHREDSTRPVTCGMDQVTYVLENGFAAMLDIPGLNYRDNRYVETYEKTPQKVVLGSETASTVSSRGVYKFPVRVTANSTYPDHQMSGYDTESCPWSNIPDLDFSLADDYPWTMGQFVWTGFDYLGEPSPYSTDSWPSHSSLFGIIDLASIPKDRYWLYRSIWNTNDTTLHIVPHWTWPGREGEVTPVMVYTSLPEAELTVNGRSMGRRHRLSAAEADRAAAEGDSLALLRRYRLIWDDVPYEPGEITVTAYDDNGRAVASESVRTAGKPYALRLDTDCKVLQADGDDLAYVTVSVVDKDGNECPAENRLVRFYVKGCGSYRAAANGDPTSLDLFHLPQMHLFSGKCTAIVQSTDKPGTVTLRASAKGLRPATIRIPVRP